LAHERDGRACPHLETHAGERRDVSRLVAEGDIAVGHVTARAVECARAGVALGRLIEDVE
jgi:hypothetical protein